ncbi:hypothetical protein WAZ86_24955 (plasmid) [Escherichia coli]|nr:MULTISPECIES: hypothetical protein [Enterobacteriaceae]HCB1535996.1 hypothetical protein [Citrobacter braakii]EFG4979382.1 hypothetical protein [Escherichia coli]EIM7667158.1 hypothetical protein [Escherichia coli]EKH0017338.1 hypothetical protein [Escherichia coli]EKT0185604.1 hypothetical protein [Escherichia coli]
MPPWWVHQKTGSEATSIRPFVCCFDFVGVAPDLGNHASPQPLPSLSLYQVRYWLT